MSATYKVKPCMTQIPRGKVFGRSQAAKQSSRVFFMIDNLLMCWGIQKECNVYNPSQSFLTTETLSQGQLEMLSWPYLGVEHSSEPFPGFSTHETEGFPFSVLMAPALLSSWHSWYCWVCNSMVCLVEKCLEIYYCTMRQIITSPNS